MHKTQPDEIEKRKFIRFKYPSASRPTFRARGQRFEIKDVSRGGLKFHYRDKIKIRGWIKGTINMVDGTCFDVEGIVVRTDNNDMGLAFIGDLEDVVYRRIINKNKVADN